MELLRKLDHPALFIISLVLVVTAGSKVLAYLTGKLGLSGLQKLFAGQ